MRIHLSTLFLLPLGIALAYPTENPVMNRPPESPMEPSWIGSFADDNCTGAPIGTRPNV